MPNPIEQELRTYLLTQSAVTNLVSTRVYYNYVPENAAFPLVTISAINRRQIQSHDGDGGEASSLVQLSIGASDYLTAKSIAAALRAALIGKCNATFGSTSVRAVLHVDEDDLPTPSPDLTADRVFGIRQDWTIWYATA